MQYVNRISEATADNALSMREECVSSRLVPRPRNRPRSAAGGRPAVGVRARCERSGRSRRRGCADTPGRGRGNRRTAQSRDGRPGGRGWRIMLAGLSLSALGDRPARGGRQRGLLASPLSRG